MKVLITGSNGFIGSYVCERLKKEHLVIGVGTKDKSRLSKIEYYKEDIQSESFITNISKKVKACDIIVHSAALIDKNNFNDKLIDINCKGSLHVVELAKNLGAKQIINISSLTAIGEPIILPITEQHQTNPNTLYHATKLLSEYIVNLASQYKIMPINLRISSPIGAGMNENTILPVILKHCLKNEQIVIYGKGKRRQNYIDVRDIVEAIAKLIGSNVEGTYNIASETTISNIDLARLCKKITGAQAKIVFNNQEDPEENYCWETSTIKAKNAFSFRPRYTLTDSIKNILDYWNKKN